MRVSIVVFPGSNCDHDAVHAWSEVLGAEVNVIWHKEHDLKNPDLVFIPGGFSFGDYLRSGAIARFSPIMNDVASFYQKGGYLFGVCNGFQILCELGILPGALLTNAGLKFICRDTYVKPVNTNSAFTLDLDPNRPLNIPIAHGMGRYHADEETLKRLEDEGRIAFRYCDEQGRVTTEANPNGSLANIAGILDPSGRALGMMPHPERHAEAELGSTDGASVLATIKAHLESGAHAAP